MKRIISILTTALYTCIFSAVATETSGSTEVPAAADQSHDTAQSVDTPAVVHETTATEHAVTSDSVSNSSESTDSVFDVYKYHENSRTCAEALKKAIENGTMMLDLSNTTDFAENGDKAIGEFYGIIKETKSFGTNSPNLYINLSRTGVSEDVVKKWSLELKKDGYIVILNLSSNGTLGDGVIDSIGSLISNIHCLNLSDTGVTDVGIKKLAEFIKSDGINHLAQITLSGTNITPSAIADLKKAIAEWREKHPEVTTKLHGGGVIYKEAVPPVQLPKLSSIDSENDSSDTKADASSDIAGAAIPNSSEPSSVAAGVPTTTTGSTVTTESAPAAAGTVTAPAADTATTPATDTATTPDAPVATDKSEPSSEDINKILAEAEDLLKDSSSSNATSTPS